MKKTAFLFPGQGSQLVGMGQDLYEAHESVREKFHMADQITGLDITDLCFNGPMKTLTETVNLQPAVTVVNLAILSLLKQAGIEPNISAGHSLGEYSALCAAGIVSEADALKMVFKRGALMQREADLHKGAMSAVIGLNIDEVQALVEQIDGIVSVANHNAEKQIVITGEPASVKAVSRLAADQKAKAIPLKVSGAWHSKLIKGAEEEFAVFLEKIVFNAPKTQVIHNVTANFESNPKNIQQLMTQQLCSPVRWYDTIIQLMQEKIELFVEVGPKKVLTGLLKKILPKDYPCKIYSIGDLKSLEEFLAAVK